MPNNNPRPNMTQRVESLEKRFAGDVSSLTDRLNRTVSSGKKRHDRLERLVLDVGQRLAQDHDAVFELNQRMARMEELVGDGLKLNLAASIAGFTEEEVRDILAFQAEEELTDSALISRLVHQIGSLKAQLNQLVDVVADTRGIVNRHEESINGHESRLDAYDSTFEELEKRTGVIGQATASAHVRIDSLSTAISEAIPSWAFPVGVITGIFAGVLWDTHNWIITTANGDVIRPPADNWWATVLCVVSVASLVIGVIALLVEGNRRVSQQSSAKASAHATATADNQPTPLSNDPAQGSNDTQVMPSVAAPSSHTHAANAQAAAGNN